jgi:hypothetical protein
VVRPTVGGNPAAKRRQEPWANPKIIEGETHTEALRALNRPDQRMAIHAQLLAGARCPALARCGCHTEQRN